MSKQNENDTEAGNSRHLIDEAIKRAHPVGENKTLEEVVEDQYAKPSIGADPILEALSKTLDDLAVEYKFTLADVLGAAKVFAVQIEEQILFQYRAQLHAAQDLARRNALANEGRTQ